MDRVDLESGDMIKILDYKTGATIPTQKEVDRNLQLTFYALAATTLREYPFEKNPEDVKLSLYFLDQQFIN
jgi:RecB family exonuclease